MLDDARFEHVWSAHGPAVMRYCTYVIGSPHDAEEVAAETFIRYLAKGDEVTPDNTEAWLIRVASNLCVSRHRAVSRRAALESRLSSHAHVSVSEPPRPDSWEYVRRLKERERLVVYLHLAEDRPFSEIGRLVGRSESAVKMTFYRAIDRLRRAMERDGAGRQPDFEGSTDYA